MANHENNDAKASRRTRLESREDQGEVVSYVDENGTPVAFTGDDDAPYTIPLGRVANAAEESAAGPADVNEAQRRLVDANGKLFVNVAVLPPPGGVQMIEGDIANDTADSSTSNPVKIGGVANDVAPTLVTVGDRVNAFFDTAGRQITDTDRLIAGEDPVHDLLLVHPRLTAHEQNSAAFLSPAVNSNVGLTIKASQGRVFQLRMLVTAPAGARYLMLFNKATAPVNGDTPVWRALLPAPGGAPGEVQDNWEDIGGLFLSTGISVAMSTTIATLTLIAEDAYFHITYK